MTPPPCVIDRSAFLGSRSPPPSRHGLVALSAPSRPNEKAAGWLDLPLQRRCRRTATVGAVERTGAVATWVVFFFLLKKKKRTYRVRRSVRDHRRLSRFLRPSCNCFAHESMCKTVAGPAVVAGSRRSPAVLRRRSSSGSVRVHTRLHLPTTSTPIFTVTGRGCMAQWWFSPPPNLEASFAWPQGLGGMVQCDLVKKKQTQTFFVHLEEGPSPTFFFFLKMVHRN